MKLRFILLALVVILCGSAVLHAQAGCSDGTREGFLGAGFPDIAGCAGGWSIPGILSCMPSTTSPACGRNAGNDSANPAGQGCNVEDLCEVGWHVCRSEADVFDNTPGGSCAGAAPAGTKLFFATRQSSNGCAQCATGTSLAACCNGSSCCGGCAQTCDTANDLFGCGSLGNPLSNVPCGILDRQSANLCSALPSPWDCGTVSTDEAQNVTKLGPDAGGVLCCRDEFVFQARYQYAAKFICGVNDADVERVLPGQYATAVNIHNPLPAGATFRKKIALTFPPREQRPGKVSDFIYHALKGDEALAVDCEEIFREFFSSPIPSSYVKGFLVIESDRSLDVTAVYTAGQLLPGISAAVRSEDVEQVKERRISGN